MNGISDCSDNTHLDAPYPVSPKNTGNTSFPQLLGRVSLTESMGTRVKDVARKVGHCVFYAFSCAIVVPLALPAAVLMVPFAWIARLIKGCGRQRTLSREIEQKKIQNAFDSLDIVLNAGGLGSSFSHDGKSPIPVRFLGIHRMRRLRRDQLIQNAKGLVESRTSLKEREIVKMIDRIIKIREKIETFHKKGSGDLEGLRNDIKRILEMPIYQELEDDERCYAVNFLQVLTVKLLNTNVEELLQTFGSRLIEDCGVRIEGSVAPGEFSQVIDTCITQEIGTFRNQNQTEDTVLGRAAGLIKMIFWRLAHPGVTIQSLKSSFCSPKNYDSAKGNPQFAAHCFCKGDKKIQSYYGPGPTGDPLDEHGLLSWCMKVGTFVVRYNYQDASHSSEHKRLLEAEALVERVSQRKTKIESRKQSFVKMPVQMVVCGFDTKNKRHPWTMDKKGVYTVEHFFSTFSDFFWGKDQEGTLLTGTQAKCRRIDPDRSEDNGFSIPEKTLSDDQLKLTLNYAQQFCEKLSNTTYWIKLAETPKERERLTKVMHLVIDGFLALGVNQQGFASIPDQIPEGIDPALMAFFSVGACKQDIDRGPIENTVLKLFDFLAQKGGSDLSLRSEEALSSLGALKGRALLVDGREIMESRLRILKDLLQCLDLLKDDSPLPNILNNYINALNAFIIKKGTLN